MRICRVCKEEKEYIYLGLDAKGACVYKDGTGGIWHGKQCYACKKAQVLASSHIAPRHRRKTPLTPCLCLSCGVIFEKKTGIQKWCSVNCRKLGNREDVGV